MKREQFRWLAGVIAAFPNRRVVGRTRLQKTIKLLQRLGFPTDYSYAIHFYGPYSEGVNSDLRLLEQLKLVQEQSNVSNEGAPYFILTATPEAVVPEIQPFQQSIDCLAKADAVVLELAATYDAFREMGSGHAEALQRLQGKKGTKCHEGRQEKALELLEKLGLPAA